MRTAANDRIGQHRRRTLRWPDRTPRWWLGATLMLGFLVGCDSQATSSSSVTAQLGPSVLLGNGGCTYAGPASLTIEGGRLTIPVRNESDFVAAVSLLKVGSAFDSVEADVDEYNDAESAGEAFELTPDPGVTVQTDVEVDPSGERELVSDVVPDTYAVLCLGLPSDDQSEGLDEAYLFGPLEVTE
jgi:hypothetical protein